MTLYNHKVLRKMKSTCPLTIRQDRLANDFARISVLGDIQFPQTVHGVGVYPRTLIILGDILMGPFLSLQTWSSNL